MSRLGAIRGVATLTGLGLAVEIGDWDRFTGSSIGAYLGLVPTESSSGSSRSPGVDHQDRERSCPQAAGRGRVATRPAAAQDTRQSLDAAPRRATSRGAGRGPDRRDQRLPPLARPGSPQEAGQRHHGGRRPRTGRLVLEPGHHARLTHPRGAVPRTQTGRWENPARVSAVVPQTTPPDPRRGRSIPDIRITNEDQICSRNDG
ncbi:MAG: transposase [Kineosporiaceae bacterium]